MTIEIDHLHIRRLQQAIRQFKIRHGPFNKMYSKYMVYIYESKWTSLFLLALSDTGINVSV